MRPILRFTGFVLLCLLALNMVLLQTGCNRAGYTIQTDQINEENTQPIYKIAASLPQLRKHSDTTVQEKINEVIAYYIESQIVQFREDISVSQRYTENPKTNKTAGELEIETKVGLISKNIVSMRVATYYHNAEAAYPQYIERCFTFNTRNGDLLTLDRIFHPESGYLNILSEYIAPRIAAKQTDGGFPVDTLLLKEATLPKPNNFTTFLLSPDRISFFFPYYLITAQKQPDVWVDVPYSEIEPLLLKQYRW
jgi:hypothetical protein